MSHYDLWFHFVVFLDHRGCVQSESKMRGVCGIGNKIILGGLKGSRSYKPSRTVTVRGGDGIAGNGFVQNLR